MRVCLVNPPPARVAERFYDAPPYPHEGLAVLGGALRAAGLPVTLIDAKRERLTRAATVHRIVDSGAGLVGFSAYTHEIGLAAALAAAVKQELPSAATVVGGAHASAIPGETLAEFPGFDYAIAGDGELALPALAAVVAGNGEPAAVPGVSWRRDGTPVSHPPAPPGELAAFPPPAWDLLPPSRYYIISTSRGCPFTCSFCANPHGTTVRSLPPEMVVTRVNEILDRYRPVELMFGNENFFLPASRPREVLAGLIAAGVRDRVRWQAQTHVSTITPELLDLMKQAGGYWISFGVESGNEEILRQLEKGLTKTAIRAAVRAARTAGLGIELNAILGHPGETPATARETIDFLAELNPTLPALGLMVPYPGTRIAAIAARGEGGYRLRSRRWADYNKQIGDALELAALPRRQLEQLQLRGYLGVFVRNRRWGDLIRFLWRYRREGWAWLRHRLTPARASA